MFAFVTYAQCRVPVSTLFAPRKSLLHMESVNCLDLLKIFSHNRKNRTGKKKKKKKKTQKQKKKKKKKNTLQPLTALLWEGRKTMTKVPVRFGVEG